MLGRLLALVALAMLAARAEARPFKVCTVSFHSPEELQVFEERLEPPTFDVVDLAPSFEGRKEGRSRPWLMDACRADLRCDVVMLSGEFGGRFFGSYGFGLGLQELEEASCDPACAGIFRNPREVFLLACNTLATKDQDSRTPRDYLRVLQDHGFDQAAAERVVQMRYGPVGPSFRESLRRAFAGVPRVYGFASVAPVGVTTAPMLRRYFAAAGDYGSYLERVGRGTQQNGRLLSSFANTSFVQTSGLAADEPGARDHELVCQLYDERRSVGERLRTASSVMARPDFLGFLPTMEVFLGRHPPDSFGEEEKATFDGMRDRPAARDEVLRLARELEVSALKLEVADFARHMQWITDGEFQRLAVEGARMLLARPLTSEIVDIVCEIAKHAPLGEAIRSEDLSGLLFQNAEGIRLVDCVAPKDPRVTPRLVEGLENSDSATRLWAAYALSRRLPLPGPVLAKLARRLRGDDAPGMRERVRWIFEQERDVPTSVIETVGARDAELAERMWRGGRSHRR